jgi:hypothetical protein
MVATDELLVVHVTEVVKSRVPGVEEAGENVPMAMNWAV